MTTTIAIDMSIAPSTAGGFLAVSQRTADSARGATARAAALALVALMLPEDDAPERDEPVLASPARGAP